MTLSEFVSAYTGKSVSFTNCEDNQCMTLLHVYLKEVFQLTDPLFLANPSAYQIYTNYPQEAGSQYFTRIENSPTNIPNPGDIVLFMPNNPGAQTGANGHVSIFVTGDINRFQSFDANYPTGSLPHLQEHTYAGVLGWLTPKSQGEFVDEVTMKKLVQESLAFEKFVTSGYNTPDDVTNKVQSYADNISSLQKQIGELTKLNEELALEVQQSKDQLAKLADITQQQATSDSASIDEGLNAASSLKNVLLDMTHVAQELETSYPPVQNVTMAISALRNQLTMAQVNLTKQAEINKALSASNLAEKQVVTSGKGFFYSVRTLLQTMGILEK